MSTNEPRPFEIFRAVAREEFRFLETDYGFQCIEASGTYVRYETASEFVAVVWGRSSYEVRIDFNLRDAPPDEPPFGPSELADLTGVEQDDVHFQTTTAGGLKMSLARLSDLLREVSADILPLTADAVQQLRAVRTRRACALAEQWEMELIRAKAAEGWQRKDYKRVQEVLERAPPDALTDAETRKLAYVRKKVRGLEAP